MDTSIIVVIAIIVVFVVVVPTMIRTSATELSRAEVDTVPEQAQVIAADLQNPGHDHTERARVFHSSASIEPTVPRPDVAPMKSAPQLSLSARAPEFAVIDGHADSAATAPARSTIAEADEQHQLSSLPVAVGETRSTYLDSCSAHEASTAAGTDNVRMLHPAVHAVFNQTQHGANGHGSNGHGSNGHGSHSTSSHGNGTHSSSSRGSRGIGGLREQSGTIPIRQGGTGLRSPQSRSSEAVTTDTAETSRRGTQIPNPTFGADEDHSMTEKATTLRESMKSLGAMTRGFALLFLASALGVVVTGVLAMFSVVHVALTGVFLGLAIVSLVIVRTLNLRRRETRARLRELEGRTAPTTSTARTPSAAPRTSSVPTTNPVRATNPAGTRNAAAKSAAASASGGGTSAASQASEPKSGEARSTGSTKAAQARAVMQRNMSAKHIREEADTGEIPLVRIRNEAAEGHTTRQVLLTGPIPIVEEEPAPKDDEAQGTDSTETVSGTEFVSQPEAAAERDRAEDTEVVADASTVETAEVKDPFMQRLQARDAWSPTPLPIPSYVEAPQVEHPVPESKAADASSYETEARSREDIAAQFAAELGYRPELSDSARDGSPLEHGRKAIRTTQAPEMGAVDDVLARRRA